MSGIATVYAIFGSLDEAESIAHAMVERRLAACANILSPAQSIYRWNGKIEQVEETPALFKTSEENAEQLISAITELHSYDVPAICQWSIERAASGYPDWVVNDTGVEE